MNHPKTFYYNYQANDEISKLDTLMNRFVLKQKPYSVFDFGCGVGKNLKYLKENSPVPLSVCGMDMSFLNIIHARAKNNIDMLIIGDEYHLCRMSTFDVVTTTSVLCHIQDITEIIEEFKRIAHKSIVICETTDIKGEFYYAHDYESFGFEETGIELVSGNEALYKVYIWKK